MLPRPKCARCGGALSRGQFATPHLPYSGVLESGIDLTAIEAAVPVCDAPLQAGFDIRDRLREVGWLLKQPPPLRPRLYRGPLDGTRVDPPGGEPNGERPLVVALNEAPQEAAVPQKAEPTGTFFWTAVGAMLLFLLGLGLIWPELFETIVSRLR